MKYRFRAWMTSYGRWASEKAVKSRMSENRMASSRSSPTLRGAALATSWSTKSRSSSSSTRRRNTTSPRRVVWQASRTLELKLRRSAIFCSFSLRGQRFSRPSRISTRQVEQRAFPPQTWVCGMPFCKEACNIGVMLSTSTTASS